jgi:hypothetical protein
LASDVRKEEGFETRVHAFSIAELKRATQNFDEENFLGHGGFGQVYKVSCSPMKIMIFCEVGNTE